MRIFGSKNEEDGENYCFKEDLHSLYFNPKLLG